MADRNYAYDRWVEARKKCQEAHPGEIVNDPDSRYWHGYLDCRLEMSRPQRDFDEYYMAGWEDAKGDIKV